METRLNAEILKTTTLPSIFNILRQYQTGNQLTILQVFEFLTLNFMVIKFQIS